MTDPASSDHDPSTRYPATNAAEWTFLIYMNGVENDLSGAEATTLKQLGAIPIPPNLNVVYEVATARRWQRGRLSANGKNPRVVMEGPQSGTTRDAITAFVDWAASTFPSRYTGLFLKDHGVNTLAASAPPALTRANWRRSWISPRSASSDPHKKGRSATPFRAHVDGEAPGVLTASGLRTALERSRPRRVDLYGFDACCMGTLEYAFEVRNVASYVVASQDILNSTGWPYRAAIDCVREGHVGPRELATRIVEKASSGDGDATASLSAFELSWAQQLGEQLDELGAALLESATFDVRPQVTIAPHYVDLGALFKNTHRAERLLRDFCFARTDDAEYSGVNIAFPQPKDVFNLAGYGGLQFARGNRWTDYIFHFCSQGLRAPVGAAHVEGAAAPVVAGEAPEPAPQPVEAPSPELAPPAAAVVPLPA